MLSHQIDPAVDLISGEARADRGNDHQHPAQRGQVHPGRRPGGHGSQAGRHFVQITIADTGIGIPEAALPRIFQEFYRADNARAVERDGTGLGLAFAKQVVERHGGRIWVENNPGGGSTFTFTLPGNV